MSQGSKAVRSMERGAGNPGRVRPIPRWIGLAFFLATLVAPQRGQAEPVPLHFSTFAPNTNVANMQNSLGPGYTRGLTMDFRKVATCAGTIVDARVTAVVQPDTEFATGTTNGTGRGYIPNYKATILSQPHGDLGFLYANANRKNAGITLTLSFFDGTGDRSGTFRDAYAIPDLRLRVYDVDGEPGQDEWFDAFTADGLYSYATGSAAAGVKATTTATGVHFPGGGKDLPETDTSGAVQLRYRNTSRITLAFGARQHTNVKNPVFAALDGDSSLPMTGNFRAPTALLASWAATPVQPAKTTPSGPDSSSVVRTYSADGAIRLDRRTPAAVAVHVPFDYTLKVTNVSETPVQDVVVRESLPKNFQLQSSNPDAKKEDTNLSWAFRSLEPKASREIMVSGLATTAEKLEPCATVSFVVPVCSDIAVLEPKLTFTKTASKEVLVCDPIALQYVVTNAGTGALQDVQIVDTLPEGLRTTDDKTELVFEVGSLAPGQSRQWASSLKAARTGEYVDTAIARAQGGLKVEATTTTIVRQPVLAIAKTGPARQYLGRPLTYEITVTNKGDAPAAQTVVEDTIPAGAQDVQMSPAGTVSGAKVLWQWDTLAVNDSKKVSITYTPAGQARSVAQAATAAAICADTVSATAETALVGIAAVLLEVIDTDDPVLVGGQTTYVITATNQGTGPSTDVQITAVVEDTEEIVATDGPTAAVVEGLTVRFAPLVSLAPKAKATWQVTIKARKPGDVRFRATMTTAQLQRNVEETEATQLYE